MTHNPLILLLVATCLTGFASMVNADEMNHDAHATMEDASFGEPGEASKVDRTITIVANEIAFDVKNITVKAGETVRFVLVNKGEQPHELVIGSADEMAEHRQMMRDMAGMDMTQMHHNEGNSISTEPGETKELIWHFGKAGTYEFACNYPGHAELGMEGRLIVK